MKVERIERADQSSTIVDEIAALFVAYRRFYERTGDEDEADSFIRRRVQRDDSMIWRLVIDGRTQGFCQVYPGHSSLQLMTDWCLNDLFVTRGARGAGGGRLLVNRVLADATEAEARSVWLETAPSNAAAQSLYVSLGFVEKPSADDTFLHYVRTLKVNDA